MLIGIIGQSFTGKTTLTNYLKEKLQFKELYINEPTQSLNFESLTEAINYATTHWQDQMVIKNIHYYEGYQIAMKRPFFLLIGIHSPLTLRYHRYLNSNSSSIEFSKLSISNHSIDKLSLTQFILQDEDEYFNCMKNQQLQSSITFPNQSQSLYELMNKTNLSILNDKDNLIEYYKILNQIDFCNKEYLRPSWDTYFLALCELASKRSNCMKRRVGCILVSDYRVISTGYNGTPKGLRNCNEGGCGRCNGNASCGQGLDQCICMHAEEVGIVEVVYTLDYGMDQIAARLFKEAGITLRQVKPTEIELVR
ncbi:Deoxycytidine monophosphate (dCMP) deaminase [Globomyces sp. JEL0801]|nr:Deoxycytidine monophosphate (dCMP) deaminase [Globomyces sp. JEL0801]